MSGRAFDILSADEVSDEAILRAIESAFGTPFGVDWFQWKHRDGPWGPSRGAVAVDDAGVIGVRLLLPWKVRWEGEERVFMRATEAATVPRARGAGVFTALNRALMDRALSAESRPVFVSTPNARSREGYAKLGWTLVGHIRHRYCLPSPLPARGHSRSYSQHAASPDGAVVTQWSDTSLRWRLDARSGRSYRCRQAGSSDGSSATVAYRTTRSRGMPLIVPVHTAGPPRRLARLLWSVACREHALAVVDTWGSGADVLTPLSGVNRQGGSLWAVWHPYDPELAHLESWSLSMRELEAAL